MYFQEAIFLAAQGGDTAALNQLLTHMRPDIRRYARYQCHRSSAIEDIVQEALLIVYRRVDSVRNVAALGPWLAKIVSRLCMLPALMLMRGVEELRGMEDSAHFAAIPTDDLRIDIARALESLSRSHREIILLRDMQEMTIDEISISLQLTREATKSRLHRARVLVREYLLGKRS